jgi:hypothetical protein
VPHPVLTVLRLLIVIYQQEKIMTTGTAPAMAGCHRW